MDLTCLPDDELMHVLGFLKKRDLLRCRGVCRRLRDLALHPHVWRHRGFDRFSLESGDFGDLPALAATLRLAPCLSTLTMHWPTRHLSLATLMVTTNCAVSRLHFKIKGTGADYASMVLARQASLGRLRGVHVELRYDDSAIRRLLKEILYTRGLTSIKVEYGYRWGRVDEINDALEPGLAIPASLRLLKYELRGSTLPSYLQWHADTLQEVILGSKVEPPAGTTALLAALPHLQQLDCPLLADMGALLDCPALQSLTLRVDTTSKPPFFAGVMDYLRKAVASRLPSLVFCIDPQEEPGYEDILVRYFVGPGRGAASALRSLRLSCGCRHLRNFPTPLPQLVPLASVLPRLTNLVTLDLGGPPTADFLKAMDGNVLPNLDRLDVFMSSYFDRDKKVGFGSCPHDWAHSDEPRALLRRYPRLHLVVYTRHNAGCEWCGLQGCDVCSCLYCTENLCHDFKEDTHVLFSHDHQLCDKSAYMYVEMRV